MNKITVFCLFLVNCRGLPFRDPPIHPIQDMVNQNVLKSQSVDPFYADRSSDRAPVPQTIPFSTAFLPFPIKEGKEWEDKTKFVSSIPVSIHSKTELFQGQKHYNIHCSPCHGITGKGDGLVIKHAKGTIRPPSLHEERLIEMPVGQIYQAIKQGVNQGNMPAFSRSLDVDERWLVVAYVKVLQISQNAPLSTVPEIVRKAKGW